MPRCGKQERAVDRAEANLQAARAKWQRVFDRASRWQGEADDAEAAIELELRKRKPDYDLIAEAEAVGARAQRNAARADRDLQEEEYDVSQAQLRLGEAMDALDECRSGGEEPQAREIELTKKYRAAKRGRSSSDVDVTVRVRKTNGQGITRAEGIDALSYWVRTGDLPSGWEAEGVDWKRMKWDRWKGATGSSAENAMQDFHGIFRNAGIGYVRSFAELRSATVDDREEYDKE